MIGVVTDKIVFSQSSIFLLKNLNKLNKVRNCSIFCNEMHERPVDICFNIMQQIKSYQFEGTLITDNLLLTQTLNSNIYTKKKYYYVWNFDWILLDDLRFKQLTIPFLNDEIELIARSESHAEVLEKLFKKPKYIMEDWDWEVLQRIGQDE